MSSSSDNRPSLNDPQVVEKILFDMAREGIGCRIACAKGIIREEDANTIEEREVENRARIFLNRDKNYSVNPEWHKPGAIDAFLAKSLSLDVRGSEEIIKAALSQFMWDVREKLNIPFRPDITETQWREEIKTVVVSYRELLQGVARAKISTSGQTQIWTKSGTSEIALEKQEFLGDPTVIEKILVGLARESLNAHRAVISGLITIQDAAFIEEKEIEARTRAFLGRDKNFAIDANWNKAGAIDAFLSKELKLTTRGAENVIKDALAKFLVEVRQHFDISQHPNFTEAEWKSEVQNDISKYRDLLMGLQPQEYPDPAPTPQQRLELPPELIGDIPTTIFERKDLPKKEAAEPTPTPVKKTDTTYITKPFLADPQAVERILTNFIRETIGARIVLALGKIKEEEANVSIDKELTKRAKIFLGQDKAYAADTGWNVPGGLDKFLAKQLNIQAENAEETVKAALLKFAREAWEKLDIANHPRLMEEEWQPKIQGPLSNYRNLFVGLPGIEEEAAAAVATVSIAESSPTETVSAAPASLGDQPPTQTQTAQPVEEETPAPAVPAAKKSSSKARPPKELAEVADQLSELETAGVGEEKERGNKKWLILLLLFGFLAVGSFFVVSNRLASSRQKEAEALAKKQKQEQEQAAIQKKQEEKLPKVFALKNGKLMANTMKNGSATEKEVEFSGAGSESRAFEFWYDLNTASGTTRFLIASQRDPLFQPEYGAPEAWDLWLTDEQGMEKFIGKSVFRAKFSPDGTKIAYVTSKATLHVVDLAGKELAKTERAYEPGWSGDGKTVVYERVPEGQNLYPPSALQLARFFWESNHVEIIMDGRFDDVTPHYHPSGKWILFVSGDRTGGTSFWKVSTTGGEPKQLTNLRFSEGETDFVPTPHQTTVWSADGRWFLYDFKMGQYEQTWGLEFDEKGAFKRALKLSDGLSPQWTGPSSFVCQKRSSEGFEMVQLNLPSM